LFAQGRASLSGVKTNPSGAVLQGAEVTLDPTNLKVASDMRGQLFMNDLTPGTYTLSVTYVGFAPFTKTVQLEAGGLLKVNAQLQLQTQNMEVLVTAPRPSAEVSAVNIERSSDNIVQALPAEVTLSLPNANMADALGRLPRVTLERDEGEGKYVQIRGTDRASRARPSTG
jgi:Carboxypeptidase regulatory-like domain